MRPKTGRPADRIQRPDRTTKEPEMRIRDVVPIWRLERLWQRRRNRGVRTLAIEQRTDYEELLSEIISLPENWHGAGCCGSAPLRAMAIQGQARRIIHTAETGVGKSTLLLS